MKKTLLFAVAIIVATTFVGQKVQAQAANHAVKINLMGAIAGTYQLAFEKALNEKLSVQLGAGIITGSSSGTTFNLDSYDATRSGMILIPEARLYFSEGLQGLYAGAFARYRATKWDYDVTVDPSNTVDWSHYDKRTAVGGGIVLGYQILAGDAFCIDIFLGPQYKSTSNTEEMKDATATTADIQSIDLSGADKSGVGLRLGFSVGVAF